MNKRLHILSIGGFSGLGESNTCLQRDRILQKFGDVDHVDTTAIPFNLWYRICNKMFQCGFPVSLPDLCGANEQVKEFVRNKEYDIIWVDKGIIIKEDSFIAIKQYAPKAKLIGYSPDYMCARHNQSKDFLASLKYFDVYVTTKSYSVNDLKKLGCSDVYFVSNAYQAGFHKPYALTPDEQDKYTCDVGFIGAWEKERSDSIIFLARHGIKVKIWGSKEWEEICTHFDNLEFGGRELHDESYCKAICGCKISLCFLRKMNLDLQTTRSVEIPACGSFMLAERTIEHLAMFEEGKEAAYFSSNDELLQKCRYYLAHDDERKQIAAAGHQRCENSGYSNYDRIKAIIDYALNK